MQAWDQSLRCAATDAAKRRLWGTLNEMDIVSDTSDGRSQRERMLAGDLYRGDDPEIARDDQRAMRLLTRYNENLAADEGDRRGVLCVLVGTFGAQSVIRPPLYCDLGYQIHIGERCFINFGLVALDVARITIGDDAQLGPNVQLLTPTHPVDPALRLAKWESAAPISIGNNAWLGGGVIVLPGVTIGDNTVVGAGSVVTADLPANVVAVGNPARVIRQL
jgi:maltose O-acetyltransferase